MLQALEVNMDRPPHLLPGASQLGAALSPLAKEAGSESQSWLIATVTSAPAAELVDFKIWGPLLYPFSGLTLIFFPSGQPGSPNLKTAGSLTM